MAKEKIKKEIKTVPATKMDGTDPNPKKDVEFMTEEEVDQALEDIYGVVAMIGQPVAYFKTEVDRDVNCSPAAAIVTKIYEDKKTVNLTVFPDNGAVVRKLNVPYSDEGKPCSWDYVL